MSATAETPVPTPSVLSRLSQPKPLIILILLMWVPLIIYVMFGHMIEDTKNIILMPAVPVTTPSEPEVEEAPWPRELAGVLAKVERGVDPTNGEVRRVGLYGRRNPEDARPLVLLGRVYMAKRWYSEALRKYRTALARHPEVAADATVRAHMLELVRVDATHGQAVQAIVAHFGADLRPDVVRAIQSEPDEDNRDRLTRLLDRLE